MPGTPSQVGGSWQTGEATSANNLAVGLTTTSDLRSAILACINNYRSGLAATDYTVKYGGVDFTRINRIGNTQTPDDDELSWWILLAPAVGTANVVCALNSGNFNHLNMGVCQYKDVNQASPYRNAAVTTFNQANSNPTLTLTAVVGDLTFCGFGNYNNATYNGVVTRDPLFEDENNSLEDSIYVSSGLAVGTSEVHGVTLNVTSGNNWWGAGFSLVGDDGSGGGIILPQITRGLPRGLSRGFAR